MTRRDFWLNLFQTNDVALACAIHLCNRYVRDTEFDEESKKFINQKIHELDEEIYK